MPPPDAPPNSPQIHFGLRDLIAVMALICLHLSVGKLLDVYHDGDDAPRIALSAGFSASCAFLAAFACFRFSKIQDDFVYRLLLMIALDLGFFSLPLIVFLITVTGPIIPALFGVILLAVVLHKLGG